MNIPRYIGSLREVSSEQAPLNNNWSAVGYTLADPRENNDDGGGGQHLYIYGQVCVYVSSADAPSPPPTTKAAKVASTMPISVYMLE